MNNQITNLITVRVEIWENPVNRCVLQRSGTPFGHGVFRVVGGYLVAKNLEEEQE